MSRYTIHNIADEQCNSLCGEKIAESNDIAEAKRLAQMAAAASAYGAGIRDKQTGEIDVGFGFGSIAPSAD